MHMAPDVEHLKRSANATDLQMGGNASCRPLFLTTFWSKQWTVTSITWHQHIATHCQQHLVNQTSHILPAKSSRTFPGLSRTVKTFSRTFSKPANG